MQCESGFGSDGVQLRREEAARMGEDYLSISANFRDRDALEGIKNTTTRIHGLVVSQNVPLICRSLDRFIRFRDEFTPH